ncbi:MAG: iron ABC transporter permease [Clostridia bacterium]|nr:iron ABC transporter permease [Clostridia bacterium]NCC75593.1 iron ABC transporter permease [Clostridia bacterium]
MKLSRAIWPERFGHWPFLLLIWLPLIVLFVRAAIGIPDLTSRGGRLFDWGREAWLLFKTLVYASCVAGTVCLIGFLTAAYVCGPGLRQVRRLTFLLLVSLTIPSSVHALGWLKWLGLFRQMGFSGINSRGWLVSWLVQSMAMLPVGLLIIAGGVLVQNREQFLAARLLGPDARFVGTILPGLLRPQLLTAGAIVWILTLNDYAIPSIFSVNTYAIEIFVEYSSSYSLTRTILKSLPLVLLQTAVLSVILGLVPQVFLSGRLQDFSGLNFRFPRFLTVLAGLGPAMAVLAAAVPLSVIFLSQEMWLELSLTLGQSVTDYLTSLCLSALAVVIGSPLALWMARWIHAGGVSRRGLFLLLGPVAIPGTLTGIALIHLFNQPWSNWIYNSLLLPVLAILGRFLPFVVLVILAWLKRLDRELIWAARLLEPDDAQTTRKILIPLLAPGIVTGAILLFLLGLGELGATVLTVPPGFSTLTIRLYNYLHYGATDRVLGLSFLLIVTIALIGVPLVIWQRSRRS